MAAYCNICYGGTGCDCGLISCPYPYPYSYPQPYFYPYCCVNPVVANSQGLLNNLANASGKLLGDVLSASSALNGPSIAKRNTQGHLMSSKPPVNSIKISKSGNPSLLTQKLTNTATSSNLPQEVQGPNRRRSKIRYNFKMISGNTSTDTNVGTLAKDKTNVETKGEDETSNNSDIPQGPTSTEAQNQEAM